MKESVLYSAQVCALASVVSASTPTSAADWLTCNGNPVKWYSAPDVSRNRCSIPTDSTTHEAYNNGANQWNDLASIVDDFLVRPSNDCSWANGDGVNEVGLVDPEDLDGALGLTWPVYGACVFDPQGIHEMDITIANDLPMGNPSPVSLNAQGRGTFVHEFGHLFGFLDENSGFGAMHQTPRPYTGGSQAASVFPTDTAGLEDIYGLDSSLPNLLPSAMRLQGTTISLWETEDVDVCRGDARTIRFRLANSGSSSSGNFGLRLRLTTSSSGSGGTTAATYSVPSLVAFGSSNVTLNYNVPNVVDGLYYLFVDMDYSSSISEVRNGDNTTRSGQRLDVECD